MPSAPRAGPAPAAAEDKDGAAVAELRQARKVAFEAATGATRVRLGFRLEATRRQLAGGAGFAPAGEPVVLVAGSGAVSIVE